MSTARGGIRGRGRGSGGAPRGPSANRGASFRARGSSATRATFGAPSRGSDGIRVARGAFPVATVNGTRPPTQNKNSSASGGGAQAKGNWTQRYESLTKSRERERRQAIAQGLIADPDKPRSLAEAITPVGTCQDMCAQYERAQRAVQNDVWAEETDPNHSVYSNSKAEPEEARMVKKFRRAAAGVEEQLPSDLRPPDVLKRTCDYLFDEVVGNAPKLEKVHHFVWDRTRAIRNDFSIQQVTKAEDLRLAIDCYERIARFHILSLHQLAVLPRPYDKYDAQQEREQLDRTLLSLMQYYDDSRGRVDLPHEAEFRAYCVIFQLQDPMPDLEDRVQSWPRHVVMDKRVQKALELYAAACNTMDSQGPLKPRASHLVAQQDWQRFWALADSKEVSYLMACVAEIYFNLVRRTALNALWRSFRQSPNRSPDDWTIDALCDLFALDEEEQVVTFCEAYGFSFTERADGQQYLDLASVKERTLPQPNVGLPKQWRSELVESKRYGRILPAIINGLAVKQAEQLGLVTDDGDEEMDMEGDVASTQKPTSPFIEDNSDTVDGEDSDSLFIPENREQGSKDGNASVMNPLVNGFTPISGEPPRTFGAPSNGFGFGQPSGAIPTSSTLSVGESLFDPKPIVTTDATATKAQSLFDFSLGSFAPERPPEGVGAAPTAPVPQTTFTPPVSQASGPFTFSSLLSENQSTGEAPKFSFGTPSGSQDGVFARSTANGGNNEMSPAQTFSFSTSGAPPTAINGIEAITNAPVSGLFQTHKQASVESAPTSPKKSITFGAPAIADGPMVSQPKSVTHQEAKPSQPHFTLPIPAQTTHTANVAPSSSSPGRKPSVGPHQVKRPSPLSHSVSSEDVSTPNSAGTTSSATPAKQPRKELLSDRPSAGAHRAHSRTETSEAPKDDLTSIVNRLADEITNDEIAGFLTQYVEFAVQQAITSAQEQVTLERDTAEASRFRKDVLFRRYFKRWKDLFWGRKFAKRGNKRRERARRGLEELKRSGGSDTNSLLGISTATSMAGSVMDDLEAKRTTVDRKFQQTVRNEQRPDVRLPDHQANAGSKRPLSPHGASASGSTREAGHKRMKSTSHVDDRGRVTKPATTSNPNTDILKRSSFLGFTMPTGLLANASNGKRSNYFRLKAMGIETGDGARGTKRRRDESADATPRASPPSLRASSVLNPGTVQELPPSLRMSTLLNSTNEQPRLTAFALPPSSAPPKNDADEALFARLKAARESLAQGTNYLKDEVAKEEQLKRSLSASQSSNDSPSLVRARVEARWRASHAASTNSTAEQVNDVPAYRLRESRFVPREQYGRAVERAKEMRETRSRENSRRESTTPEQHGNTASTNLEVQKPQAEKPYLVSQQTSFEAQQEVKVPNGLPDLKLAQWQPPSTVQETDQLAQPLHPTGWGFAHAPDRGLGSQSFAEQPANPFSSFASQPSQTVGHAQPRSSPIADGHDFTIQPSQVQESLSASFGNSQPQGFGQQLFHHFEQHSPTPPQPDSYINTQSLSQQAFSLLSDDDEQEPPTYANHFAQQPADNGNPDAEHSDEILDDAEDEEVQDSYQYTQNNMYAALANELGGDTEEDIEDGESGVDFQSQSGEEVEDAQSGVDFQSQLGEEFEAEGQEPNGYGFDEQEGGYQDEDLDGDVEDAEDYDSEEELEDDDETEGDPYSMRQVRLTNGDDLTEDEDEEDDIDPRDQRLWNGQPPKNDAFQDVGATVEEAIELSD